MGSALSKGVSLITTVYNESGNILRFLNSYANQTVHADEFVIVDGGSDDGTVEIINQYKIQNPHLNIKLIVDKSCVRAYSKGPIAKGRNIAIKSTQYECVAVTDAGCMLDKYWLENISRPILEQGADVVAGWYKPLLHTDFQRFFYSVYMPKVNKINPERFLPSSRSIAFRKKCWHMAGGYPEKTYTGEDTLFDLNLRKKGFQFYFASDAVVYWDCPKTLAEALLKYYSYAYGDGQNGIFHLKYLVKAILLIIPIDIFISTNKIRKFWYVYAISAYRVAGYYSGLCSTILHGKRVCL